MTAEEFYDWCCRPEQVTLNWELHRGEPMNVPFGSVKHGAVCATVVLLLSNFLVERKCAGYLCSNNSGVIVERTPDTVIGPDVAYYEKGKRLEDLGWFFAAEPPRLAIEVLDSGDSMRQIGWRVNCLLKCGSAGVWLLDPAEQRVVVYQHGENPVMLTSRDELCGGVVLPDFRSRVAELFALPSI